MHPAAKLQFERVVDEFVRWRALGEDEPAMEVQDISTKLPPGCFTRLGLSDGASYAAGAKVLFQSLAGQTFQPWPYDFSRKVDSTDSDVRDLHPQPSDDSAFQA
jgi:hypothetical protein